MIQRRRAVTFLVFISIPWWFAGPAVSQTRDTSDTEIIGPISDEIRRPETSVDVEATTTQILELTATFREEQGLDAPVPNEQLQAAARNFAEFMAETKKYGHEADGNRPSERAKQEGYEYCMVSENIAYTFSSHEMTPESLAEKLVDGWKDSPRHRENMLDPAVTQTGVAVAQSERSGYCFAVQMFGRPRAEQLEFTVLNESAEEARYTLGERDFTLPPRYSRMHTVCMPASLEFVAPDDDANYPVQSGDRFIITGERQVRTERTEAGEGPP